MSEAEDPARDSRVARIVVRRVVRYLRVVALLILLAVVLAPLALYRADPKYRPIWARRPLCLRKGSALPRTGLAAARAEGFQETPGLPARLDRRHLPGPATPAASDG